MPGRLPRTRTDVETVTPGREAGRRGPARRPEPGGTPAGNVGRDREPDHGSSDSLLVVLRGIGAVMFLTTLRIIVARDGVERRPRSGVTAYPLMAVRHLRLELGTAPSGRIAVSTEDGQEAVSMFFDARSLDRAHELIDVARPLIARQRRSSGDRPARPPSGPAGSGHGRRPGPGTPDRARPRDDG